MFDQLRAAIDFNSKGYSDIRYEENSSIRITYQNDELREFSQPISRGGHIRAYVDGGKAIHSFSDLKDLKKTGNEVRESASLVGKYRKNSLTLADTEVVNGTFPVKPELDPRSYTLKDKQDLLLHYKDLILSVPKVTIAAGTYEEWFSKRWFLNSEGSRIEYELLICNISFQITAKDGEAVQNTRWAIGGSDDYGKLLNRDDSALFMANKAVELTKADPIPPGIFPVVMDPSEASVFIHEAFGHLSEADGLQDNPSFLQKLKLGQRLGKEILNVTDDGTLYGYPGWHVIDDEGVKTRRTELIKNGILSGRMHSRETAYQMGEELSGNVRAVGPTQSSIVRMSNIFIENGTSTFDELISSIDKGYYLVGAKGGQTSGDMFTFGAQYGYEINEGKLGKMVRDINMSGTLFETLNNISMIGDDLKFSEKGGCGKGSPMQLNSKSGKGSPHIKIDAVTLGGVE